MGVRGLTTFIARDSDRYLKHTELKNCQLVIDGSCVASHLYKWRTKRDSAFGGDYDEYLLVVKNFFLLLKKCNITPIVIFDGGYEQKKLKTVLSRLKNKLTTLKTAFNKRFSDIKFFPLFMRQIFCEAVASLKVTLIQCEFEADGEIAALARHLKCPVLSYDSDFFIYDVLYIPFSTVQLDLVQSDDGIGLPCGLYDIAEFLKEYPGLKKVHLPLLATLLGNDFAESYIFNKFFQQIPLPRSKNTTNLERRILGLLNWLRHESEASAVRKIQSHIGKVHYNKFASGIEVSKVNYTVGSQCVVNVADGTFAVDPAPWSLKLSESVISLLSSCSLPSFVITLVALRCYFLPLQVEDLNEASAHDSALPIIQTIDQLLCSQTGDTSDLILYIRQKRAIKQQVIENIPCPDDSTLGKLSSAAVARRRKFIFTTLDLEDSCVDSFREECHLFLACFLYWCKTANPSLYQAHALLLQFLACQAKCKVGLCRPGKDGAFDADEVTAFAKMFAPHRKTSESGRSNFSNGVVHVFNCFQSVVYHVSVLNVLLGRPLRPCKIAESFSGTLLYNLHASMDKRTDVLKDLEQFLSPVASFAQFYVEICDKLIRYFPAAPKTIEVEKKRKKKRKSKSNPLEKADLLQSEESDQGQAEDLDYSDLCNKFHLLSA